MLDNYSIITLIFICGVYLTVISYITYYFFKKIKNLHVREIISVKEYKTIIRLAIIVIIIDLPYAIIAFLEFNRIIYGVSRFVNGPILLISNAIPAYIAILIFYRKYLNPIKKLDQSIVTTEEAVQRVFDSQSFYSAISTVLPKGEKDENYGFDYIPFMLQNLQEKRNRFQNSSSVFLRTTIALSLIFVSITIFFGYILLNESSVGVYREMNDLNTEVSTTNKVLNVIRKDISGNDYLTKIMGDNLKNLSRPYNYYKVDVFNSFQWKIKEAIDLFNSSGSFEQLYSQIDLYKDSILESKVNVSEKYNELLSNTYSILTDFKKFKDNGFNQLNNSQADIKTVLSKIQDKLDKPSNSQNELIKRLILSLVIVTFFLAILRYFRSLQQSHHNEMLKAENEDLLIRKFYVSYKSACSPEERKQVLTTFLSENNRPNNEILKKKNQVVENDVLKELLNALLKKL